MLRGRLLRLLLHGGPGLAALLATCSAASPARAGSFTADGAFLFDPQAAFTLDFEDPVTGDAGGKEAADKGALSGGHVLQLGMFEGTGFPVKLPKERRTYRVSVWIRDGEIAPSFELSYTDHTDEVAALYPTGRVTSDGWVELAADHVRVDGVRLTSASFGLFAPGAGAADAIEIVADGDDSTFPAVPNAVCGGAVDPSSCAPDQICTWSECRNAGGWVPPIPADRDHVTDYLQSRMTLLFGPYLERKQDFPAVMASMTQMRLAKDRFAYWNGFLTAVRKLHDGHTTTSNLADFVLGNPRPLALCFLEGDADLTHTIAAKDPDYLDVLVSHTGGDHNLGLHAGDRLVSVDGQHPIAWARSLIEINASMPGISNHTTFAELASSLRAMISRYAKSIEVIRCDAKAGTCGMLETIAIDQIPFDPPGTMVDSVTCDNRPLRHLPGAPKDHATGENVYSGIVVESDPAEKIYGLEWESLSTTTGQDGVGPDLHAAVNTWFTDAKGVIMDHRTGFGGTILGPEILWSFSVPTHADDVYVDRTFGEEEQPSLAAGQALFNAALNTPAMEYAGSANPAADVPVALLLTEDVSASDWLPQGMKGSPTVKLFAPFQTNGGFSTRYSFGYWLSIGYVMAVGDDILADGSSHNGHGVEPDVVVLPKQSDLLNGKDTVYEAALAWVRKGLKP
jgi:hypothetical protein